MGALGDAAYGQGDAGARMLPFCTIADVMADVIWLLPGEVKHVGCDVTTDERWFMELSSQGKPLEERGGRHLGGPVGVGGVALVEALVEWLHQPRRTETVLKRFKVPLPLPPLSTAILKTKPGNTQNKQSAEESDELKEKLRRGVLRNKNYIFVTTLHIQFSE